MKIDQDQDFNIIPGPGYYDRSKEDLSYKVIRKVKGFPSEKKKALSLEKYRADSEKASQKSSEHDLRSIRKKIDYDSPGPTSYYPKESKFDVGPKYRFT